MKKLLLTLLALLLVVPAMAEEPAYNVEGNYLYSQTHGGVILTDYIPEPGDIGAADMAILPAEIAGNPVVMYGFVFEEFAPLEKIIVQEGVTDIGDAFCWSWFDGEIELPASLNYIAEGSLYGLRAEITVSEDNPFFTCADGFLIDTRTQTLLYTAPSAADKPLPAVRRLGAMCLDNWHAGETVHLPETLTSIASGVFSDMVDTKHVNIPAGVTQIGAGAFDCTGLTEVTLPAGLTAIEALTFSCNDFTEVVIPEGVTRIESWAFYLCPLERVEIPASCTFVAWDAFDPEVELVLLGENTHVETMEEYDIWVDDDASMVDTQGEWAYILTDMGAVVIDWRYGDTAPETVEIPAVLGGMPVVGVGHNALNTNNRLGKGSFTLVIPEGVRYLEKDALMCCHDAERVVLPSTLVDIPEGISHHLSAGITLAAHNPRYVLVDGYLIDTQTDTLIYTCVSASEDKLPAVRRIGNDALANYGLALTTEDSPWSGHLVIPEGVEELGCNVAYDDPFLKSVTLPESLRVIETSAFECILVASGEIVVPAGVELIQFGAFGLYTPIDAEIIVTSPDTRIETAREYAIRTGETWVLEDDWTPMNFTFAWE